MRPSAGFRELSEAGHDSPASTGLEAAIEPDGNGPEGRRPKQKRKRKLNSLPAPTTPLPPHSISPPAQFENEPHTMPRTAASRATDLESPDLQPATSVKRRRINLLSRRVTLASLEADLSDSAGSVRQHRPDLLGSMQKERSGSTKTYGKRGRKSMLVARERTVASSQQSSNKQRRRRESESSTDQSILQRLPSPHIPANIPGAGAPSGSDEQDGHILDETQALEPTSHTFKPVQSPPRTELREELAGKKGRRRGKKQDGKQLASNGNDTEILNTNGTRVEGTSKSVAKDDIVSKTQEAAMPSVNWADRGPLNHIIQSLYSQNPGMFRTRKIEQKQGDDGQDRASSSPGPARSDQVEPPPTQADNGDAEPDDSELGQSEDDKEASDKDGDAVDVDMPEPPPVPQTAQDFGDEGGAPEGRSRDADVVHNGGSEESQSSSSSDTSDTSDESDSDESDGSDGELPVSAQVEEDAGTGHEDSGEAAVLESHEDVEEHDADPSNQDKASPALDSGEPEIQQNSRSNAPNDEKGAFVTQETQNDVATNKSSTSADTDSSDAKDSSDESDKNESSGDEHSLADDNGDNSPESIHSKNGGGRSGERDPDTPVDESEESEANEAATQPPTTTSSKRVRKQRAKLSFFDQADLQNANADHDESPISSSKSGPAGRTTRQSRIRDALVASQSSPNATLSSEPALPKRTRMRAKKSNATTPSRTPASSSRKRQTANAGSAKSSRKRKEPSTQINGGTDESDYEDETLNVGDEEDVEAGTKLPPIQGRFTDRELRRLDEALETLRDKNDLSEHEANDLIQRDPRGRSNAVDLALLKELWVKLAAACPRRSRQRVIDVCRKRFHNFVGRGSWTQEQDTELAEMIDTHGEKWTLVGRLINRHPMDVRDRWRNVVVCGSNRRTEYWDKSEVTQLLRVVNEQVQRLREKNPDNPSLRGKKAYQSINWESISGAMDHTRSRLQCFLKWKSMGDDLVASEDDVTPDPRAQHSEAAPTVSSRLLRKARRKLGEMDREDKLRAVQAIYDVAKARNGKIAWSKVAEELEGRWELHTLVLLWNRLRASVAWQESMSVTKVAQTLVKAMKKDPEDGEAAEDVEGDDEEEERLLLSQLSNGQQSRSRSRSAPQSSKKKKERAIGSQSAKRRGRVGAFGDPTRLLDLYGGSNDDNDAGDNAFSLPRSTIEASDEEGRPEPGDDADRDETGSVDLSMNPGTGPNEDAQASVNISMVTALDTPSSVEKAKAQAQVAEDNDAEEESDSQDDDVEVTREEREGGPEDQLLAEAEVAASREDGIEEAVPSSAPEPAARKRAASASSKSPGTAKSKRRRVEEIEDDTSSNPDRPARKAGWVPLNRRGKKRK